jgi:recombinational DNA repair protein RecR
MTRDQHKARHTALHEAFSELIADYLLHHPESVTSTPTCMELMLWSHRQACNPTETASEAAHAFAVCAHCGNLVTEQTAHVCATEASA